MRRSYGLLGIVAVAVLTNCGVEDSVSPRIASTDANALRIADGVSIGNVKVYCFNPTSCVAAAYRFSQLPDDPSGRPQTQFSVFIQNLQGTFPVDGPNTELRIRHFRFQFFEIIDSPSYADAHPLETMSTIGNVQLGNNSGAWGNDSPAAGRNSDTFVADGTSGIVGCVNQNPPLWFSHRTCPSAGLDGWVRVDFVLRHLGGDPSTQDVRRKDFEFSFGNASAGLFCRIIGEQFENCTELPYSRVLQALRSE